MTPGRTGDKIHNGRYFRFSSTRRRAAGTQLPHVFHRQYLVPQRYLGTADSSALVHLGNDGLRLLAWVNDGGRPAAGGVYRACRGRDRRPGESSDHDEDYPSPGGDTVGGTGGADLCRHDDARIAVPVGTGERRYPIIQSTGATCPGAASDPARKPLRGHRHQFHDLQFRACNRADDFRRPDRRVGHCVRIRVQRA